MLRRSGVMPKIELDGLPVIDADESDEITVAVSADDMQAGNPKNHERHPIAIALRRKRGRLVDGGASLFCRLQEPDCFSRRD